MKPSKQRPVWGADHAETFSSLSLVYPILDRLQSIRWASHLRGIDALEQVITNENGLVYVSLDLSRCDATFSPKLVALGLKIVALLLDLNNDDPCLHQLFKYYTTGDIATPEGIVKGVHGLPSGIGMTNLIETLVLKVLFQYLSDQYGGSLNAGYHNGDDGLLVFGAQPVGIDQLVDGAAAFGLIVNGDKSSVGQDFSYLQRHRLTDYPDRLIMSTARMLGRILYSERATASNKEVSIRQAWTLNTIMKLENCKRHPSFERFIDFVRSGDQYNLSVRTKDLKWSPVDVEGYSPFEENGAGDVPVNKQKRGGFWDFETVRFITGEKLGTRNNYAATRHTENNDP